MFLCIYIYILFFLICLLLFTIYIFNGFWLYVETRISLCSVINKYTAKISLFPRRVSRQELQKGRDRKFAKICTFIFQAVQKRVIIRFYFCNTTYKARLSFSGLDIEAPRIHCPDNIETVTLEHHNSANISWQVPTAEDNSGEEASQVLYLFNWRQSFWFQLILWSTGISFFW